MNQKHTVFIVAGDKFPLFKDFLSINKIPYNILTVVVKNETISGEQERALNRTLRPLGYLTQVSFGTETYRLLKNSKALQEAIQTLVQDDLIKDSDLVCVTINREETKNFLPGPSSGDLTDAFGALKIQRYKNNMSLG